MKTTLKIAIAVASIFQLSALAYAGCCGTSCCDNGCC